MAGAGYMVPLQNPERLERLVRLQVTSISEQTNVRSR